MLPCTSPLERPDLPFIFPLLLGLQTKPYLQATKAVIEPDGEMRDEASIYMDLCRHSGVSLFGSKVAQVLLSFVTSFYSFFTRKKFWTVPQEFVLNLILKSGKQISFKKLLKHKHGYLLDNHEPGTFVPDRVLTDDKKIHLAPTDLMDQAKNLSAFFEEELSKKDKFKLISKSCLLYTSPSPRDS